MKYLDDSKLADVLAKYFGASTKERIVGVDHRCDSAYYGIVRFFGANTVDPACIQVKFNDRPFEVGDPLVAQFAAGVERIMRDEGRLYDGLPAMKLAACDLTSAEPSITVQPVNYGLQAGTCYALDLEHELFAIHGGTLREYYLARRTHPTVESNPLAISLGVCGYLMVEENNWRYLLQVKRSGNLASMESSYGPSAAGGVDWSTDHLDLAELTNYALRQEVREELNLSDANFGIVPLAWAMEIFRGERPQLFCLIVTSLTRSEIDGRLAAIDLDKREFDNYEWLPLEDGIRLNTEHFASLNFEARMNYLLLEEFQATDS